jgi:hypothetical protein
MRYFISRASCALAAASLVTLAAGRARAMAQEIRCDVSGVLPFGPTDSRVPWTLPANLPSFLLALDQTALPPPMRLLDVSVDPPQEVPLRVEARAGEAPDGPALYGLVPSGAASGAPRAEPPRPVLVAGHDYRFEYTSTCALGGENSRQAPLVHELSAAFRAAPAAPPPASFGTLVETDRSRTGGDSYFFMMRANPSSDMLPWANAYGGALVVDGAAPDEKGSSFQQPLGRGWPGSDVPFAFSGFVRCPRLAPDAVATRVTTRYVARPLTFEGPAVVSEPLELTLDCTPPEPIGPGNTGPSERRAGDGCSAAPAGRPGRATFVTAGLAVVAALAARGRRRARAAGPRTRRLRA